MTKILACAGSLRKGSYNKKLLKCALRKVEATYIDLKDYALPIYDGDIEEASGLPENALKLKELFWEHDSLLIASPEYNSAISGVLKNMIDWVSRPATEDEAFLSCFLGKKAVLMSASLSPLGGVRGLLHLSQILRNIQVTVLPAQKCLPLAHEAFDAEGNLKNPKDQEEVERLPLLF